MSSNLLKGGYFTGYNSETVTIDNNEIIKKKLEEIRRNNITSSANNDENPNISEGFTEGITPMQVSLLTDDEQPGDSLEENDNSGIKFHDKPRIIGDVTSMISADTINATIDKALREASEEAARIIEEAKNEADNLRKEAYDIGQEEGYKHGISRADSEIESKINKLEAEYNAKEDALKAQYDELLNEIEPKLISKLTDIYEHVIGVNLSDSTSTVMYLLNRALGEMDGNRSYIIHVSSEDVERLKTKIDVLSKASGVSIESIEIMEDHSLEKNGCMIETDRGIFDIGLDTQLNLLSKQLRILSFNG